MHLFIFKIHMKNESRAIFKKRSTESLKEDIDPDVITISDTLISNGYQAFVVGGCIRDMLLGKTPKDFDIATDASPPEICKLFNKARMIHMRYG